MMITMSMYPSQIVKVRVGCDTLRIINKVFDVLRNSVVVKKCRR
jgi:hypothetical protein